MGGSESVHESQDCLITNSFHNLKMEYEGNGLLLLAGYLFDEGCTVSGLSKSVMTQLLLLEQHERLLSTRSHYRICRHYCTYSLLPKTPDSSPLERVSFSTSLYGGNYFSSSLVSV